MRRLLAMLAIGILLGCGVVCRAGNEKNSREVKEIQKSPLAEFGKSNPLSEGTVVYRNGFSPSEMNGWKLGPFASVESGVLTIRGTPERVHNKIQKTFDCRPYAGKILVVECETSYENISLPKHPWNGVKVMFAHRNAEGSTAYPQAMEKTGSAEWHKSVCCAFLASDAVDGVLNLGLEEVLGTVRFRNLKVSVLEKNKVFPVLVPASFKAVYTERVLGDVRRRGAMSPSSFTGKTLSSDLPDLRSWGANLIRWQLIRNWGKLNSDQNVENYLNWVRARIPDVKQVLDRASALGMKVVLDLHVAPGGRRSNGDMNMFYEKRFAAAYLEAWRLLASSVKGHSALYGYDLINEPCQTPGAPISYLSLQYEAAKIVRGIDSATPIIVESNLWDSPRTFDYLSPIPLDNVIYQVHMYDPGNYTHQGVKQKRLLSDSYPGKLDGVFYDRTVLKKILSKVRAFQLKYGARIYVGEFSAVRWAKGRDAYLRDLISIFEEYGWDWSYHAFREWSGWSVEHSDRKSDPMPVAGTTPAKQVLLDGFAGKIKNLSTNNLILTVSCAILSLCKDNGGEYGNEKAEDVGNNG